MNIIFKASVACTTEAFFLQHMDYLELHIDLQGKQAFADDIITAQLADIGFESFTCDDRQYKAYIQTALFDKILVESTIKEIEIHLGTLPYSIKSIETVNWNAQWESQFEPVEVDSKIIIRAPFHLIDTAPFTYDIIIEPKMSFGTGHHETTYLVLKNMLSLNFANKRVADCGCGTGVLGIAASLMGASEVFAFDYDPICYENTIENIEKNAITNMKAETGVVSIIEGKEFDILLANINRNILVQNMHFFSQALSNGGYLIVSGFYQKDMPIVEKQALQNHLKFVSFNAKNNWVSVVFCK